MFKSVKPRYFQNPSSSTAKDPCLFSSRCLIVYLAPWCPYCKSSQKVLVALENQLKKLGSSNGIRVVVGMDTKEKLEKYASNFSLPVYIDDSKDLYNLLNCSGVPSWTVIDMEGHTIFQESGSYASRENKELGQLANELISKKFMLLDS
jgi:thiol-disulfide isomerase/thioredoxin